MFSINLTLFPDTVEWLCHKQTSKENIICIGTFLLLCIIRYLSNFYDMHTSIIGYRVLFSEMKGLLLSWIVAVQITVFRIRSPIYCIQQMFKCYGIHDQLIIQWPLELVGIISEDDWTSAHVHSHLMVSQWWHRLWNYIIFIWLVGLLTVSSASTDIKLSWCDTYKLPIYQVTRVTSTTVYAWQSLRSHDRREFGITQSERRLFSSRVLRIWLPWWYLVSHVLNLIELKNWNTHTNSNF